MGGIDSTSIWRRFNASDSLCYKKEPDIFERNKLERIVGTVSEEYKIQRICKETFDSTREHKWSCDLCSQFKDYDDYHKRGVGVVAIHNGEVVSGASSYTVYRDGIEIEIDTKEDYRR